MGTPNKRITPTQNQVGALRLLSPWTCQIQGYQRPGTLVPRRATRDASFYYGDNEPTTAVDPDEYIVRIGAHIFATKYMRYLKRDWYKDLHDTMKFYQFLAKMSDISVGSLIVDDTIFTNGETQNYVMVLEWPPHGRTNMRGLFGGYWSIFKAVTNDVDQVGDPGKYRRFSQGVFPYPIDSNFSSEDKHDPRNQEELVLPTGQRLPYGYVKQQKIQSILESLDWSDRDGEAYLPNTSFDSGLHIDYRFGAAAMSWMDFIPGHQAGNNELEYGLQHPAVYPILTKRSGSTIRACSPSELAFTITHLVDHTVAGADAFHTMEVGSVAPAGGNHISYGCLQGLRFSLENTSGSTLNLRGIIPLKSFSWIHKLFGMRHTAAAPEGLDSEVMGAWNSWWYGDNFGGDSI